MRDSAAEEAYRQRARAWLEANRPETAGRPPVADGARDAEESERSYVGRCRQWQRRLYDHGWAGISWPVDAGGQGGTVIQEAIFQQEQERIGAPTGALGVTLSMAGPTVIAHGDAAQRERFLDPMLRGAAVWCQLFSEPGAGSDLASLTTRAVEKGDGWSVTGQKVWSSGARHADWGLLLARTSNGARKHDGITYFALDMTSPGIDVRPLHQMNGSAHFNEVFLDEVLVPNDCVIGAVGDGWQVARTTLSGERNLIGSGGRMSMATADVIDLARQLGRSDDPRVRAALATGHCREQVLRFMNLQVWTAASKGLPPGPQGSLTKLLRSKHLAQLSGLAIELLGAEGTLAGATADGDGRWQFDFLSFPALRIGGGTDEIQKTIIAERMLGLPRERHTTS